MDTSGRALNKVKVAAYKDKASMAFAAGRLRLFVRGWYYSSFTPYSTAFAQAYSRLLSFNYLFKAKALFIRLTF